MVLGAVLVVAGLAIRAGIVPVTIGGGPGGPQPSGGTTITILVGSPVPAVASPATPIATSVPDELASPAAETLWFADDFDTVAAWPVGQLDWLTTAVEGGTYRIDAQPTDLPVVVMAAAGEGSPGRAVIVIVELAIAPGSNPTTGAGLAVVDAVGTRFLALVAADGRVSLLRDSIESLDLLASGSTSAPVGTVGLGLSIGAATTTVSVDGIPVTSAQASIAPNAVGLAVWAMGGPATIDVDTYRVWSVGDAARP
jgi:hypothetical protein